MKAKYASIYERYKAGALPPYYQNLIKARLVSCENANEALFIAGYICGRRIEEINAQIDEEEAEAGA
ncbi:MAG: hypothetical protein K6G80_00135 [Treponema sp.]|nr:hypothetical protein [Treponema sp.]